MIVANSEAITKLDRRLLEAENNKKNLMKIRRSLRLLKRRTFLSRQRKRK